MNWQSAMQTQQAEKVTPVPGGVLQRAAINPSPARDVPPIVHEALRSPGQPLDAETRAFVEPHFGHDFSGVRVHIDAKAAESARAVNALAYTVGRDVVFDAGQYAPQTHAGQRLLAHELTHVVQQGSAVPRNFHIAPPHDTFELDFLTLPELYGLADTYCDDFA